MVARGDLGVSIARARVPLVQKDIIHLCRAQETQSIVATDMMRSMVDHPHPTRAEVSDVEFGPVRIPDGMPAREALVLLEKLIDPADTGTRFRLA